MLATSADDHGDLERSDSVVDGSTAGRTGSGAVYHDVDCDVFSSDNDDDGDDVFVDAKEYFRGGWGELLDNDSVIRTIVFEDALDSRAVGRCSTRHSDVTLASGTDDVKVRCMLLLLFCFL